MIWRLPDTRLLVCAVAWAAIWLPAAAEQGSGEPEAQFGRDVRPFLVSHCIKCHGGPEPEGGLALDRYTDAASLLKELKDREIWHKVLTNLRGGIMPPQDQPRPDQAQVDAVTAWLDAELNRVDCDGPRDPGRVTIRRLNREEYNNTVRDLVGIDFQPADDFPSDDVGYGFDNIGDVLSLPPLLLEKYLAAAEEIMERAIVVHDPSRAPRRRFEAASANHTGGSLYGASGWALYSRGEVFVSDLKFESAGEYVLRARAFADQAGPDPARMAFSLDDEQFELVDVTAEESESAVYEATINVEPGARRFAVAFVNDYYRPDDPDPDARDRNLYIEYLEVQGPIDSRPASLPDTHRKIIFREPSGDERDGARQIIERFATRAYRRPAAPDEVERLLHFVDLAGANGECFERGIQLALTAVLVSPHFLYRVELDPEPDNPDAIHDLNEFELASRLSYFLWSSMPDDELFRLAAAGALRRGDNLAAQVRRMLNDPKSRALAQNFAGQWLEIRRLGSMTPDPARFPDFDEPLRSAMQQETELFFAHVMDQDRSVLELLDADYTFVNDRLARHYGLAGVEGEHFRRVSLPDNRRGGVLTQASVLTVTSNPTRTSPVKRGKWILEEILGTPPPPPPPGVEELKEEDPASLTGTLRQRMEQHRANPNCAVCHSRMDPLGFGLENFDAIGAWRDREGTFPIDASGTLPDGSTFNGPGELKAVLKSKQDQFVRALVEKMLTYALGRGLEYYDRCAVDDLAAALAKNNYRASTLILEIAASDPFQKRRGKGAQQ